MTVTCAQCTRDTESLSIGASPKKTLQVQTCARCGRSRCVEVEGLPPQGGRGGAPDHSLGSGWRQRFLTSQSPRFVHGSLREGLRGSHAHTSR